MDWLRVRFSMTILACNQFALSGVMVKVVRHKIEIFLVHLWKTFAECLRPKAGVLGGLVGTNEFVP